MNSPDPQRANHPGSQSEITNGAIIDPNGREIPITESMIQQACNELDKALDSPGEKSTS